jgi:hypothetical protein
VLSRTDLRSRRALEIFPEFAILVSALVRALDIDTLPTSDSKAPVALSTSYVPSASVGSYSSFVPRTSTGAPVATLVSSSSAPVPRSATSIPVPSKKFASSKRESKAPVQQQRYVEDDESEDDTAPIPSVLRVPLPSSSGPAPTLAPSQGYKPTEAAENAFARTLSWMEANDLITPVQREHLDQLAVDEDPSVLAALVGHQVNGDQGDLVHSLQLIAAMETVRARNLARGERSGESGVQPLSAAATASRNALAAPMTRNAATQNASTSSPLRPSAATQYTTSSPAKQSSASLPRQPPMSSPQRAPAKASISDSKDTKESKSSLTPLRIAGYNAADEAKAMHETILQLVRAGKLGGSDGVALTKLVVGRLLQAARELQPPSPVGGQRSTSDDDDDFDHVPEATAIEKDSHHRLATIFEQFGRSSASNREDVLVGSLKALVLRLDGGAAPAPAKTAAATTTTPAKTAPTRAAPAAAATVAAKRPAASAPFAIVSDEDEDTSDEDDEEENKKAAAAAALGGDDAAAFAAATEDLKTLERELLEKMVQLLKLEESITDDEGDELLRLGRNRDELLMAAFNVYQQDQNWSPFRNTAVRLAQVSLAKRGRTTAPPATSASSVPARISAPAKTATSTTSASSSSSLVTPAKKPATTAASEAAAGGESDEMDVLATLEPEVRQALLVVSVMASNGALSQSQARALWALILTKDEQLTKAFADARRSDDWGKLYETVRLILSLTF